MIELIIGILIGAMSTVFLIYVRLLDVLSKKQIKGYNDIWKNLKDWEY